MLLRIKPINIIERNELPEITIDQWPVKGDPLEINGEMYFIGETDCRERDGLRNIGVIPLVIKNPARVSNIGNYLRYLAVALNRIQYRNGTNTGDS